MNVILIILLFLFALILFNVLIVGHELGHLLTAKRFNVKVNEFSVGLGPRIFKIQKGETMYSLKLFPIGGSCAMEGEDENSSHARAFGQKTPLQRIIVIVSGVIVNLILGFILFFIVYCQKNYFNSTIIAQFDENSISNHYGLKINDEIKSIDNFKVNIFKDLFFGIKADKKDIFDIVVKRDGKEVYLNGVKFKVIEEAGTKSTEIDFTVKPLEKNFQTLISQTYFETISSVKITWISLLGIITKRFPIKEITGPIGIASTISEITNESLKISFLTALNNIIIFMAIITVNLGVFNLLPLPALDGGRLIFLLIELIRGKPINPKYENLIHLTGFLMLIGFMIYVAFNDILRLIKF